MRSETQTTSSDREVKLLQILAQSVGESVDYREILSVFNLFDGPRTALTDWVRRLRKKIEPDPKIPPFFSAIAGAVLSFTPPHPSLRSPHHRPSSKRPWWDGRVYRTHPWAANPGASVIEFGRPCRRRKPVSHSVLRRKQPLRVGSSMVWSFVSCLLVPMCRMPCTHWRSRLGFFKRSAHRGGFKPWGRRSRVGVNAVCGR